MKLGDISQFQEPGLPKSDAATAGQFPATDERRLAEIVLQAAAIETEERDAFLREAAGDSDLLAAARRRLASARELGSSFLAEPLGRLFETPAPSEPSRTELPGKLIGPYRLECLLGRGGMGKVYMARDERLIHVCPEATGRDDRVAIKHVRTKAASSPTGRARFWHEARTLATLDHPAIVEILDVLDDESGDWIVMELVEGVTLAELLHETPPDRGLGLDDCLDHGRQIADGLAAAHEQGIVHRDLKTENVMVCHGRRIKILDFGLAREVSPSLLRIAIRTSLTETGQVLGTPRAMSPEQIRGLPVDFRSDLFSLGVLLYEILSGRSPFQADSLYQTMHRVATYRQESVRRWNPQVPAALSDLVDRLLEKDPLERGDATHAVARALDRIAAETGTGASVGEVVKSVAKTAAPSKKPRPRPLRSWPPPELPAEPYPVLLPYTHPDLLAGRESELDDLRDLLRMPVPIVGLYGASGTGKSSLLFGGLVPLLRAEGRPVAVVRHPQEPGLVNRLLGDLLDQARPLTDADWHGFLEQLQEIGRLAGAAPVLVLDQFEEILRPNATEQARAVLGPLLAATAQRRPGHQEPPCRWLLAYRQENHGTVDGWLRDVLREARSAGLSRSEALPYDLARPERFQALLLRPLAATPSGGTSFPSEEMEAAIRTFRAVIEKPLVLRDVDGKPRYPWSFAPEHAERLARAFAEARLARPDAPLVPELQVVLAHLLGQAGPDGLVEVGEDPGASIAEALEDHLRRALESAFPGSLQNAGQTTARTRALLALAELAESAERGLRADELARAIGENGQEVLERLATPRTRLVMLRDTSDGWRYRLSHDRMAEVVARRLEEQERQGELLVDAKLLSLRRFVALKTALFSAREDAATRVPGRQFRQLRDNADALLWHDDQRAWWDACRRRRRADQWRRASIMAAAALLLSLVAWGASHLARRWTGHRALLDQVMHGEPAAALRSLVRLTTQTQQNDESLLTLLRRREVPMDVLALGLGALNGEERSTAVLRTVELAMPWVEETPADPALIANLLWALDFAPGRDPPHTARALALRERVLMPLRRKRPPPPRPEPDDADWIRVPGGSFLIGTPPHLEGGDNERPQHEVTVLGFRMLRHEVTTVEYRRLVQDHPGSDTLPATYVNWYEAYTYAAWLGGRLPTEAEWEYAARAGCPYAYCLPDGRQANVDQVAWTLRNSLRPETGRLAASPVMQLEPNPWGLYDMLGNLWEWTANWSDEYPSASPHDPWGDPQPTGAGRVGRGGSYWIADVDSRVANRGRKAPGEKAAYWGFRVVLPDGLPRI